MANYRLLICLILLLISAACYADQKKMVDPPFPRIANCYGAGLSWTNWEKGSEYWSKLGLFIGGGYDLHYDWENPRWTNSLAKLKENVAQLKKVNPNAMILPYVDVIEGPDSPSIPKAWWDLNEKGEKWSGWPGMYRINMKLKDVLQYNLDKVRTDVFGRDYFDGVFYDCWSPDKWLVPETAKLRDGKAIVMLNAWNLPKDGFESLNGVLSEDEINRVIEGKVDFEDFLSRYQAWSTRSRKPVVTTIVCHPEGINDDPWKWEKMTREEKDAMVKKAQSDESPMRFGLTTTLLGDGYFAYDTGTQGRGNWWWFKEFDVKLGHPKGAPHKNADGTWQREFDGGIVVVNGTNYDAVVRTPDVRRDVSTGRVAKKFTIPMFDGRILIPTKEPLTKTADIVPRFTIKPPNILLTATLPGDFSIVQTPGGLEMRIEKTGSIRQILWHGVGLMNGGFPVVAAPPYKPFSVDAAKVDTPVPGFGAIKTDEITLKYQGKLVESAQRVEYVETCTVRSDNSFSLHFDFTAASDLDIRMWRHFLGLPVAKYMGQTVKAGGKSIVLPTKTTDEITLPSSKQIIIETNEAIITIESSIPLGLMDDRKYGSEQYLLSGYPISGKVKQGTKLSVDMKVTVADKK